MHIGGGLVLTSWVEITLSVFNGSLEFNQEEDS